MSIDDEETYDTDNNQIDFFTSLTVDGFEDVVFIDTNMYALKDKEKNLREKKVNTYYRCKDRDSKIFEKMRTSYLPHVTLEKLDFFCHVCHTQTNKAVNTSVAVYAPK